MRFRNGIYFVIVSHDPVSASDVIIYVFPLYNMLLLSCFTLCHAVCPVLVTVTSPSLFKSCVSGINVMQPVCLICALGLLGRFCYKLL